MLFDLEELLDQNQDFEASEFRTAASRLLRQQTLYREDWNSKGTYEFVLRFRGYFTDLFDALGLELVISERDLTIVLKPRESQARSRLSLNETVLLLSLREAFERGVASFDIGDHGEVEITSMALLERYEAVTGRQRPAWARVREILEEFKRRRFIAFGEEFPDEIGISIVIRPSIREITGEGYLARVDEFIAAQGNADISTEGVEELYAGTVPEDAEEEHPASSLTSTPTGLGEGPLEAGEVPR